jgi:hypothetical protein
MAKCLSAAEMLKLAEAVMFEGKDPDHQDYPA